MEPVKGSLVCAIEPIPQPAKAGFLLCEVGHSAHGMNWVSLVHTSEIGEMEMTAHKHAAIIKAKADNMDLVLFSMSTGSDYGKWSECNRNTMPKDNENIKYFICLPGRKNECLHWLNGGEVEFRLDGENWQNECEKYHGWVNYCGMMNHDVEFRVKPRKEKRWIVAHPRALASMMYFESEERARSTVQFSTGEFKGGQVIEIEIEI